jgi:hypothetical protein
VLVDGVAQDGDFMLLAEDQQEHRVDVHVAELIVYASVPTAPGHGGQTAHSQITNARQT